MPPVSPRDFQQPNKSANPLEDWQIERIEAGLADVKAGRTVPADVLFAAIAEKYGWNRAP
jgi:predicted transcriptional regulator